MSAIARRLHNIEVRKHMFRLSGKSASQFEKMLEAARAAVCKALDLPDSTSAADAVTALEALMKMVDPTSGKKEDTTDAPPAKKPDAAPPSPPEGNATVQASCDDLRRKLGHSRTLSRQQVNEAVAAHRANLIAHRIGE